MKKTIILFFVLTSSITFAQDKVDNGHCLTTDAREIVAEELIDVALNKKIAILLKQAEPKYTGNHVILRREKICTNKITGQIVGKVRFVDFAIRGKGDTLCTLEEYLIIEKHLGGGNYGEPVVQKHWQPGEGGCMYDAGRPQAMEKPFVKKWKSCACVDGTTNWLKK